MRYCRKNTVEPTRPQITIWRMHMACWIPKATNTHSEHVTFTALPLQQCLHERSSMLRYSTVHCLSLFPPTTMYSFKVPIKLHHLWVQYSLDDKELP